MRTLGISHRILVASPHWPGVRGGYCHIEYPPTLSTNDGDAEVEWPLENRDKQSMMFRHEPMMSCSDFAAVRTAASQGLGVAFLPEHFCHRALEKGAGAGVPSVAQRAGDCSPGIYHA
jgi:DNA-binding transcriptional LysR family regulator